MAHYPAAALGLMFFLGVQPALAQSPGWAYSPLPDEGDRASMGCARGATPEAFDCLVVRCEDDYSTGLHVYTSRAEGGGGRWQITVDREEKVLEAVADTSPYSGRFLADAEWLLDRLRHGTFVYLRHEADPSPAYAYIDLSGSFRAIEEALYWCAPRAPVTEQNPDPDVDGQDRNTETHDESPPAGTQ